MNRLPANRRVQQYLRVLSFWIICLGFVTLMAGCVAQQADVVRIKRELDAKISQLDKSKSSLQLAVTEANAALERANVLIAGQRQEIQGLLHARAEVMDQVATLKETDLSQVRGAIEKNQHLVDELDQKMLQLDSKVQTVESKIQRSHESLEPLVKELRMQLTAEEQLRAEQGGKLGEFRTSLVDYQEVLTALRQDVAKQEQQVTALRHHVDQLGNSQSTQHQQLQSEVKGIQQHIQTVVGTLDQISTTFSGRLDAYEQQQKSAVRQTGVERSMPSQSPTNVLTDYNRPSAESTLRSSATNGVITGQKLSEQYTRITPESDSRTVSTVNRSSVSPQIPAVSISSSPSSIQPPSQGERVVYQRAFNLLRAKHYDQAANNFSGFLRSYPDSPLAANSQYWLGECYYGQRRFQEAIDEFERVFTFYPSSTKVPASLLKIGYSHLELKQPSMARSVFQQLVRTYPQSQAAIKAHGRLQEVNARLHNPS